MTGELPSDSGFFTDSGQLLGNHFSVAVALGDLDGDGDLDAFVANTYQNGNRVWINQEGQFTDSGQVLGSEDSNDVALGDLDGDGDLDAFVANDLYANRIWLNDGGVFHNSGQDLGNGHSSSVALGDLDGDGDLDAMVANDRQPNRIWLNDGGTFDTGQHLGNYQSRGLSLGDLDGDGDLDAFVANYREGNRVWLNEDGSFYNSGQLLGDGASWDVSLGDVDKDGDLDAFVANAIQGNRVWFNENGKFSDSGQSLGDHYSFGAALGDLDADGDLDAFVANLRGNRVWKNEAGVFVDSGQTLGSHSTFGVAVGDVDADGDLDVFAANYYQSYQNRVWLGSRGSLLSIEALDAERPEGNTGTTAFTFVVYRRGSTAGATTVEYAVTGSGRTPADGDDFGGTLPTGEIQFADGETLAPLFVEVTGDTALEHPERFTVQLSNPTLTPARIVEPAAIGVIGNDDGDPPLLVTSLEPTHSGFSATFNKAFQLAKLNLHDSEAAQLGPADVVVRGANLGEIRGTVIPQPNGREIVFLQSGGILEPDTYTVTFRSGTNGFVDDENVMLDGDGDGLAGTDFSHEFTVEPPAEDAKRLGIPDFVRGAGQGVNLPANTTVGIPFTLSDGDGVRRISATIHPTAGLLELTGASLGDDLPPGTTIELSRASQNRWRLQWSSPQPLPEGEIVIAHLEGHVPAELAGQFYNSNEVIDIEIEAISDGGDDFFPAIDDDALHVAAFFGDLTGNGKVNAIDSSQLARVAAFADSGFSASPLTDPMVLADITGNGRINAGDASHLARFAALVPISRIPPIPLDVDLSPARLGTAAKARRGSPVMFGRDEIANSHTAPLSSPIIATLDQQLKSETVTPPSFVFHTGQWDQRAEAAISHQNPDDTALVFPTSRFFLGELLQSTTGSIQESARLPGLASVGKLQATVPIHSAQWEDVAQALGLQSQAEPGRQRA